MRTKLKHVFHKIQQRKPLRKEPRLSRFQKSSDFKTISSTNATASAGFDALGTLPTDLIGRQRNQLFYSLIDNTKYDCQGYDVITRDGYQLRTFRIQSKLNLEEKSKTFQKEGKMDASKPPVLLQHGLADSSDCWVISQSSDTSLALFLADQGYDVWLGNNRGNKYSTGHIDPETTVKEYWDFSFDEMGTVDLPANLDLILANSEHQKAHLIGYSQGSSQIFAGLSDEAIGEEVNSKASRFLAVCPPVVFSERSSFNFVLAEYSRQLKAAADSVGLHLVAPGRYSGDCLASKSIKKLAERFPNFLNYVVTFGCSDDGSENDRDTMAKYLSRSPNGASLRSFNHYGQLMKNSKGKGVSRFQKYDYGEELNLKKYGTVDVPEYDLGRISVPVSCFKGTDDGIVDLKDCEELLNVLKEAGVEVRGDYEYKNWGHVSFVFPRDPSRFFEEVLTELRR